MGAGFGAFSVVGSGGLPSGVRTRASPAPSHRRVLGRCRPLLRYTPGSPDRRLIARRPVINPAPGRPPGRAGPGNRTPPRLAASWAGLGSAGLQPPREAVRPGLVAFTLRRDPELVRRVPVPAST